MDSTLGASTKQQEMPWMMPSKKPLGKLAFFDEGEAPE
jgi:hypothetical protein